MYWTGRCAKSNKPWLILAHGNKENPLIANSLITQASCVLQVPGTTYFKYKLHNDPAKLKGLKKPAGGGTWVFSLPCRTEPFPGFSSPMLGWGTGWGWCAQSRWIHVCNRLHVWAAVDSCTTWGQQGAAFHFKYSSQNCDLFSSNCFPLLL